MVAEVPMPGCLCSTLCNGLLPCGSGGCRSGAASLSGGKSGKSGGKSGRCRAATLAPPFNGAAVVKCFSAVFKFSAFFLRGFKQEQKYYRIAI